MLASPQPGEPGRWAVEGRNCTNGTRAFEALLHWQPSSPQGLSPI